MPQITRMMQAFDSGDRIAAEKLLPLVYDELRALAATYLAKEQHAHTRQATSLVHEAYLRLVNGTEVSTWSSKGHFFGAAATAIRRILVENARRRNSLKHGGGAVHTIFHAELPAPFTEPIEDLIALDDALNKLNLVHPQAAELVQLVYFAGFKLREAAEILEISSRSADRLWSYAKAWLRQKIRAPDF